MGNLNKASALTQSFDRAAPKDAGHFNGSFGKSMAGGFGHGTTNAAIGAPNTNSEMNGELIRLKEENGNLHQEIHGMEAKIKRMEAWNTNDQYLSYEDEAVKDAIDKNRD
jgi:hypothetical protein